MLLTLMRHGHAERWSGNDAGRGLTEAGQSIVRDVVRGLRGGGWLPGAVVCSPLQRSRQTARIVIEQYPGLPLEVLDEVVSAQDVLLQELEWRELVDPLIIGHEPGLSQMAARLMGAQGMLCFEEASVACFRIDGLPPRQPAELIFFAPPSFTLASHAPG